MMNASIKRRGRRLAATLLLISGSGCSELFPSPAPHPAFYTLDTPVNAESFPALTTAPTLIINPPHAAAGFDSPRIIYVREPHRLEYFAHSEWVDPPAHLLAPLLVLALEKAGSFRTVLLTPSAATSDLRLDTELIHLQHEFGPKPSRVRFTLRAYLVDNKTRRVLATQTFEAIVPATHEDPYGGIVAANRAVQEVLGKLATFCAAATSGWNVHRAEAAIAKESISMPSSVP